MGVLTIPSVFTAVDKVSSVTRGMAKSVKSFTNSSTADIARMNRSLRQTSQTAKRTAQISGGIGLAIAAPLVLATRAAITFEKQMSNVSTLIDTSKESMTNMSQEVLNLSTKLPVALDDLTVSLFDIRSAGVPANKAMATLEASAKLGVAGIGSTAEATNILTSAMNAFKAEGLEVTEIQDILFKTSKAGKTTIGALSQGFGAVAAIIQSAGVKFADFQAATAALTTVGTPAAQAQTQLRAAIVSLQKPTVEMNKVFKELGVKSAEQVIQKFGGMGGAFKAIGDTSKKLGLNLGKVWSSTEAGAAVISLTGATSEAYITTLKEMTSGANAVDEAFAKQNATGAAAAQLAENNMKALSITVGTTLIPVFNELIQKVIPVFESFRDWAKQNPGTLQTIVKVTVGLAALAFAVAAVSTVVAVVTGAMAAYNGVQKAVKATTWLIAKAQTAWNFALAVSKIALSGLKIGVQTVKLIAHSAWMGIVTAAQWLWNTALIAGAVAMTILTSPITLIILGIAALVALVSIIIVKWNEWGAALSIVLGPLGLIISIIQSFRRNWEMITDAFKTGGFVSGIKAIGVTLLDSVLMPLQQILSLIAKVPGLGGLAGSGVQAINDLRSSLGVDVDTPTAGEETEAINSKKLEQDNLTSKLEQITKSTIGININDPGNNAEIELGGDALPIKLTTTTGIGS